MAMAVSEILDTMLSKIESMAQAKTVLGDPVQLGDKMVVPVVKISVGFGAGGGEETEPEKKQTGSGGGGGGGFNIQPVGFIVMDQEKTAFLPVKQKSVGTLVEMIPNLLEKVTKMKSKKKGKAEEIEVEVEEE